MSRRALAVTIACALLLALALLPWTVSSERLTRSVARQIKNELGLELSASGRTTFALLPVPRLKVENATLADETGTVRVERATVRGEFQPLSFLALRPRIRQLSLSNARIVVRAAADGRTPFGRPLDRLRGRLSDPEKLSSWIGRLSLVKSEIVVEEASGTEPITLSGVDLVLRWPRLDRDLDLSGSVVWRGEPVSFALSGLAPAALLDGRSDALEASATSPLGRLLLSGDLSIMNGLRFQGTASADAKSLSSLVRWTGAGLDLSGIERPLSLAGTFAWNLDGIEWPTIRLNLGADRLDGAIAVRMDGDRPAVRATLAGDRLAVGPPETSTPASALSWLTEVLRTGRPEADYDVRLSASTVQAGGLAWTDVAAAILASRERVELSVARAMLADGVLKGRLTATVHEGEGGNLRAQLAVEKMNLAQLLALTGGPPGMSGTLAGHALLESGEDDPVDILRRLKGRATLMVRDGELAGLSLGEAPKRIEGRSGAPGAGDGRGGRTRFGQAQITVNLANGLAEIVDGSLDAALTQTQLRGRLSLVDRTLALRTVTRALSGSSDAAEGASPVLALDIRGPVDRLAVKPLAP